MELGIRGAFEFADNDSGGRRGSDTDSQFRCIINSLLMHSCINNLAPFFIY